MTTINAQLLQGIRDHDRAALAILIHTNGSSPQHAGAKVLFLPNGEIIGTIGGGCMEAEARKQALARMQSGEPGLLDLRLDDDFGWDDGLICGGGVTIFIDPNASRYASCFEEARSLAKQGVASALVVPISNESAGAPELIVPGRNTGHPGLAFAVASISERKTIYGKAEGLGNIYVEPIIPQPTLYIAGAGHIGSALAQIASLSGFEVVVVDDRPAFANVTRLPFADEVIVGDLPETFRALKLDEQRFVAIVTRGHRHDAQVLREVISSNAAYIGMIGSKRKIVVIYEELLAEGLATPEQLRRVRSPMGLTLGDVDAGEIAVSIMAEIIAVRRGADLRDLRPMQYLPPCIGASGG